jgi:hypothetical protein
MLLFRHWDVILSKEGGARNEILTPNLQNTQQH